MHPAHQRLGNRTALRMACPRIDSGRGGLGCVVHGGTHQSVAKHRETLPAELRVRPDAGSPVRSLAGRTRFCDESSRPILVRLLPVGQACPCIGLTRPATVIFWTADLRVPASARIVLVMIQGALWSWQVLTRRWVAPRRVGALTCLGMSVQCRQRTKSDGCRMTSTARMIGG